MIRSTCDSSEENLQTAEGPRRNDLRKVRKDQDAYTSTDPAVAVPDDDQWEKPHYDLKLAFECEKVERNQKEDA
jgi:hypothetical protein